MDHKFDKEVEIVGLRAAAEYLTGIVAGEHLFPAEEVGYANREYVPENKRKRLEEVVEYMMMRIVELGFSGLKKEVEMIHGPIEMQNPANAELFRDAYSKK